MVDLVQLAEPLAHEPASAMPAGLAWIITLLCETRHNRRHLIDFNSLTLYFSLVTTVR